MPSSAIFISTAQANANVTPLKDTLVVQMTPPMQFKKGSHPRICLQSMSIWNTFPNISPAQGNTKFYYSNDTGNATKFEITLAQGTYETRDFNAALAIGFVSNGHASNLIKFGDVSATGFVTVTFNEAGWFCSFPAGTFYGRLGFDLNARFPAAGLTTGVATYYGQSVADIAPLSAVYVHTNLTQGQTNVGGASASVLAAIIPDVAAGSLINYRPYFPMWIDCDQLEGSQLDQIIVRLTKSDGVTPLNTGNENWTLTLQIEYD